MTNLSAMKYSNRRAVHQSLFLFFVLSPFEIQMEEMTLLAAAEQAQQSSLEAFDRFITPLDSGKLQYSTVHNSMYCQILP